MRKHNKPVRLVAATITALVVTLAAGTTVSSAASKPTTKLVCKTVKGKKKCTRIVVKKSTKSAKASDTKSANASDTTIARASDTTIAHASDTTIKK